MQFYQSLFMLVLSMYFMIKHNKKFAPEDLTPYMWRGVIEGLIYVGFYMTVPITPLSMFSILFNSRSIITFLIEALYLKEWPRKLHLLLSFFSFIGVLILLGPSIAKPDQSGRSSLVFVAGCLLTITIATMTSYINIYTKYKGKADFIIHSFEGN